MKLFVKLAVGALILFCGFCGFLGYLTFFLEPYSKDGLYAKDAIETPVSLSELGLKGAVLSQEGNTISLLSEKGRRQVFEADRNWRIMRMAGPNLQGKLALVLMGPSMKTYKFVLLDTSGGAVKESAEMKGDIIWDEAVRNPDLHPTKSKIAYFRGDGRSHQFSSPQAYVKLGSIIEFDFASGTETVLAKDVMENPLSYSRDGSRIYCTVVSPRTLFEKGAWQSAELENFKDNRQPAIAEVDLAKGTKKILGYGWAAYLTLDDKDLAVRGFERMIGFHGIKDEQWTDAPSGGMLDYVYPFQFLTQDLVLASALPLKESDVEFFPWTGSISGRHQKMRLGVFALKNKKAAVLRNDLGRYEVVAWFDSK